MDNTTPGTATRIVAGFGNTALALAFAIAVGATPSLTQPAAVLVLAMGIAAWALWFSAPAERTRRRSAIGRGGLAVWATIGGLFAAWELAAYLWHDDHDHPTFSALADPVLSWPPARAVAALAWVAGGRQLATLRPSVDLPDD